MTFNVDDASAKPEPDKSAVAAHLAQMLAEQEQHRKARRAAGLNALQRLVPIALGHTGQCRVVGRFLLGLYNGPHYRFDLTDLRLLDTPVHEDCLKVLMLDHSPEREVHEYIEDGLAKWQRLISMWGRNDD